MKRLTTDEFIKKYEERYGKKWLWDKFQYVNAHTKSTVICPKHGDFLITPGNLMIGTGCPICGGTKKYTNDEFKEIANKTHNNFYNLDKVCYQRGTDKITVTCPIHGDFEIVAKKFLRGNYCPKCKEEGVEHKITPIFHTDKHWSKDTTETFCQKIIEKYGDKYILDKVDYKKANKPVLIGCKEHGYFSITPNHLLMGRGCPICGRNKPLTTDELIKRSENLFPNQLTYEKTVYHSTHENSIFTCKKHGDFLKSPANLLKGQGCPMCSQSKLENEIYNILQKNGISFEREKKFDALGLYRYDFYIPQKNILIECQGIQHLQEVPYFTKHTSFSTQLSRDKLKYDFAIKNNIRIIYFIKEKSISLQQEQFCGIYNENNNVFKKSTDLLEYIKSIDNG